jgi:hypothetical protein
MVGAISMIVHENATVEEALAFLKSDLLESERRKLTG